MKHTRVLSVLLVLCLLLSCLPGVTLAANENACGAKAQWKFSESSGRLTISGSGPMYSSAESWGWEEYADKITSIKVSDGITAIGAYAFAELTKVTYVSLPSSLSDIYAGAFMGCESLESIDLPDGLNLIYEYAFAGCTSLKSIRFPRSLDDVGVMAFDGCGKLTKFSISSSNPKLAVDSAGVLFNKDKTVLYMAPGGMSGSYTVPSSVTAILDAAFLHNEGLTSVEIPASVLSIGTYAFAGCTELQSIRVSESNPMYCADANGLLYNKNKTVLLQTPSGKTGAVTVADGVTKIGPGAMYGCIGMTSVKLPESLTSIEAEAFAYCVELGSIQIPDGVQSIGDYAFAYCVKLTGAELPDELTEMGGYAFAGCILLKQVTTPAKLWHFPGYTFTGCLSLERVDILSNGFYRVGPGMFMGCISLKEITFPGQLSNLDEYAFAGCVSLESFDLKGADYINSYAFAGCTGLRKVSGMSTRNSLTIGSGAFSGCRDLELVISGSVYSIAEDAFKDAKATVFYPGNWVYGFTEAKRQNYGGDLYWAPYYYDCYAKGWEHKWEYDASADNDIRTHYSYCTKCGGRRVVEQGKSNYANFGINRHYTGALESISVSLKFVSEPITMNVMLPETIPAASAPEKPVEISVKFDYASTMLLHIPVDTESSNTYIYKEEADGSLTLLEHKDTDYGLQVTLEEDCTLYVYEGKYHPFTDLNRNKFYYDAVLWAVDQGITKGTSATTFAPEEACTRKQIVTFLWRAAGSPEPESTENPFVDVTRGDQFEKAILWAVEQGITKGTDATHFSPEKACTRKQIVTFLWRAAGTPDPASMDNPFTDVTRGDQFEKAILWALEEGITTGKSETTFEPEASCTRGQIVTFLYRSEN